MLAFKEPAAAGEPALRAPQLERPRLWPAPDAARLVTYVAPAGYGKSVALQQLGEYWSSQGVVTRCFRADAHKAPGALAEAVTQLPSCAALLIDGGEWLTEPDLKQLRSLLTADARCIAIASRTPLQLGQVRFKAEGRLREVTADELAFSIEELISLRGGTDEPDELLEARSLLEYTEGWPMAVMLDRLHRGDRQAVAVDLASFFEAELAGLPAHLQDVLPFTAFADPVSLDLSAELADQPRAAVSELLEMLVASGCLMRPGDELPVSAGRYHPLFRQWLLERFKAAHSVAEVTTTYRRASRWHEGNGNMLAAVDAAIAAREERRACTMLESIATELLRQGNYRTIISRVEALPAALDTRYPSLLTAYLWSLALTDQPTRVADHIDQLTELLERRATRQFADSVFCLKTVLAARRGDLEQVRKRAERALLLSNNCAGFHHGAVTMAVANAFLASGDSDRAQSIIHRASHEPLPAAGRAGLQLLEALTWFSEARVHEASERLRTLYQAALAAPDLGRPVAAMLAMALARSCYEQNDIEAAEALLIQHLAEVSERECPDVVLSGYVTAARIAFRSGHVVQAVRLNNLMRSYGSRVALSRVSRIAEWESARFAYLMGDLESAVKIERKIQALPPSNWQPLFCDLFFVDLWPVRMQLWQQKPEPALAMLTALRETRNGSSRIQALLMELLSAVAADQLGDHRAAEKQAVRVLLTALAGGLARPLLDEGPLVARLLKRVEPAARRQGQTAHVCLARAIDEFFDGAEMKAVTVDDPLQGSSEMGHTPLTAQELQVLAGLNCGSTNRELASMLNISPETVKWHLRNIFGKLHVRNRTEAVFIARQRNLV